MADKKQVVKRDSPYSETLAKLKPKQNASRGSVSWRGLDAAVVYRLLTAITDAGGNVLFGATRDRSAWVLTVWHPQLGDKPASEYCNSGRELAGFVESRADFWEAVAKELGTAETP